MSSTIEAGIVSQLTLDAEVTDIVGGRIYPLLAPPHGELPYVTYQRIDSAHERAASGPVGLANVTVQLNCWAEAYSVTKTLAEAVRRLLDGRQGDCGEPADTTYITATFLTGTTDDMDPPADGRGAAYRTQMDFEIWYSEPTG